MIHFSEEEIRLLAQGMQIHLTYDRYNQDDSDRNLRNSIFLRHNKMRGILLKLQMETEFNTTHKMIEEILAEFPEITISDFLRSLLAANSKSG